MTPARTTHDARRPRPRPRVRSRCAAAALGCGLSLGLGLSLSLSQRAVAVEIWQSEDGERSLSLGGALKLTGLAAHAPEAPLLYPERWSGSGLFRFRLGLSARHNSWINSELAYEHRARVVSPNAGAAASGGGGGVLPPDTEAPWRVSQGDWEIGNADAEFSYRHEIDRALVAFHPAWGEVTLGRQAIGLGRGMLFGAVDVFSPFSPAEADREWRRGVDAVRIELSVTDTSSAELIAVFDETWKESALLGRFRGYLGNVDGEIIAGKRGGDEMYALALSALAGDAEVHLELALFDLLRAWADGTPFADEHLVAKAVVGASYTFDVGSGLTVVGEYHYSGFGVDDIRNAAVMLTDPDYLARYARGDTQILGRHALGLQASYQVTSELTAGLLVLGSPEDGSGMVSPSITWDAAENLTVTASAFLPWGDEPSAGGTVLESEYGGSPTTVFLQLSFYF